MFAGTSHSRFWMCVITITCSQLGASAEQKNITAEPGQNVTLTGRASNNNIIAVDWRRADKGKQYLLLYRDGHFDNDSRHESFKNRVDLQDHWMKDGDVSLILKDVTSDDTGTYECRVFIRGTRGGNLISTINLRVVGPPGPTEGTTEDGGKQGGSVGLAVGVSVFVVLLVAVVGFVIYRRLTR